ncbi:MAG TPA: STAS domain-containing protein [Ilumatobacteraceae bacterium]|nr:STAS domain-containing protein [Ilumatobacteraceae bacterium]
MLTPILTAHTDTSRQVTIIAIAGPIINREQAATIRSTCLIGPESHGLVVNLTGVSLLAEVGLEALREVAKVCAGRDQQLVFVCSELMLRSELLLADLDTLAPVLQSEEQAVPLLAAAA